MRKVSFTVALAFLFISVYSQSCLPEGIVFNSQAQIDSFQINYPGCAEIEGSVEIGGNDISNLSGLSGINSVHGNLEISYCVNLNSLVGLDGLDSVGGWLYIYENSLENLTGLDNLRIINGLYVYGSELTSLHGLESLEYVGGSIQIGSHTPFVITPITDLSALANLSYLGGNLELYLLLDLNDLTGLESLSNIGGAIRIFNWWTGLNSLNGLNNLVSIGGDLEVSLCNLENFTGLESLSSIGGNLSIRGNDSLISLTGLEGVTSIWGDLKIDDNDALNSLMGLVGLSNIGGGLYITSNDTLTSLEGIDNIIVYSIEDLSINNNPQLSDCEASNICDYLASPNGVVEIYNNASGCNNPAEIASACGFTMPCLPHGNYYFTSQADIDNFQSHYPGCNYLNGSAIIEGDDIKNLSGINNIDFINGSLIIKNNPLITNLTDLGLSWITDQLVIENNPALSSLYGLNVHSIEGDLSIENNNSLTSLEGLENTHYYPENIKIKNNNSLPNLFGLEELSHIEGTLDIWGNNSLTNLEGLNNLTSVWTLNVVGNDSLTNLEGLEGISTIGTLSIYYNDQLSECEVLSICYFLSNSIGNITIENNAIGCNSPGEVLDSCEANAVQIDEQVVKDKLILYPNPSSGVVHLRYSISDIRYSKFEVYSLRGVKVRTLLNEVQQPGEYEITFDISDLPAGIYIVEALIDGRKVREKLVIE